MLEHGQKIAIQWYRGYGHLLPWLRIGNIETKLQSNGSFEQGLDIRKM
jgi:hypothetical protein